MLNLIPAPRGSVHMQEGSVKLPDSARIRVFYIDGDSKPLCAAATVLE